jgi:23S rRNA pseudouridine1911/1915/1917 synthase
MALLPGDDGPYVFGSKVPVLYDGSRLVDCLSRRFAYQDRATWNARILDGAVRIDGVVRTDPGTVLQRDQRVDYLHGDYVEPEVPTDWRVVALSAEWMAVSKPSGMPMHSTPRVFRQTLTWQVRRLFGEGWSPVHRLDRETSGLVVFARGARTTTWLGKAFADRIVSKDYIALVKGELAAEIEVDGPIGPALDPAAPIRQAVVEGGKPAQTWIRPLGRDDRGRGTWVVASPRQGRMHQIRVHCESIGHPLVGDILYDGRGGVAFKARAEGADVAAWKDAGDGEDLHLHAWRLSFRQSGPASLPARLECAPRIGWMLPKPVG